MFFKIFIIILLFLYNSLIDCVVDKKNGIFLLMCTKVESMEFHGEASVWKFTEIASKAINMSSGALVDTNEEIIKQMKKKNTWVKVSLMIADSSYNGEENIQLIKGQLDKDDFEKNIEENKLYEWKMQKMIMIKDNQEYKSFQIPLFTYDHVTFLLEIGNGFKLINNHDHCFSFADSNDLPIIEQYDIRPGEMWESPKSKNFWISWNVKYSSIKNFAKSIKYCQNSPSDVYFGTFTVSYYSGNVNYKWTNAQNVNWNIKLVPFLQTKENTYLIQ